MRKPSSVICSQCDKPMVARGLCRNHYRAAGFDTTHGTPTLRTATCTICKAEFTKTTTNTKRMLNCSPECARTAASLAMTTIYPTCKVHPKVCAECSLWFIAKRTDKLTCSAECTKTRQARAAGYRDKPCPDCGTILEGLNFNTYCSACRSERMRVTRRANKHIRRARLKGRFTEKISFAQICERDGWICGICHGPIDQALRYPDRMSASLDHVVPLARGGTHTNDNVAATHWLCNVLKRDTMPLDRQLTHA